MHHSLNIRKKPQITLSMWNNMDSMGSSLALYHAALLQSTAVHIEDVLYLGKCRYTGKEKVH